jgi:hypothetical protein
MDKPVSYFEAIKPLNKIIEKLEDAILGIEELKEEAFFKRPLPKVWEVGQRVLFLEDQSSGLWEEGSIGYIAKIRPEYKDKPATASQFFYVVLGEKGYPLDPEDLDHEYYGVSPHEVELIPEEEKL